MKWTAGDNGELISELGDMLRTDSNGAMHIRLADGPCAGRWINAGTWDEWLTRAVDQLVGDARDYFPESDGDRADDYVRMHDPFEGQPTSDYYADYVATQWLSGRRWISVSAISRKVHDYHAMVTQTRRDETDKVQRCYVSER